MKVVQKVKDTFIHNSSDVSLCNTANNMVHRATTRMLFDGFEIQPGTEVVTLEKRAGLNREKEGHLVYFRDNDGIVERHDITESDYDYIMANSSLMLSETVGLHTKLLDLAKSNLLTSKKTHENICVCMSVCVMLMIATLVFWMYTTTTLGNAIVGCLAPVLFIAMAWQSLRLTVDKSIDWRWTTSETYAKIVKDTI